MEIMEYLCRAEQRGADEGYNHHTGSPRKRMNVPSRDIHSCRTTRTDSCCPIRPKCQAKQQGIGEYVNLSSMAKKKL